MPSLAYPERQRHPDIRICRPHRYSLERFLPRSVVSCGTLPWGRKARRRAFGGQEKSHPNLFSVAEAPKTTIYQVHPPPSQADCGIAAGRTFCFVPRSISVTMFTCHLDFHYTL